MGIIKLLRETTDYVFPRFCTLCGSRLTMSEQHICTGCVVCMPRTGFHRLEHSYLARLLWTQFPVVRAASWIYYNSETKLLLLNVKYYDGWRLGRYLGRMMSLEMKGSGFFNGIDLIVPLPLHFFRRLRRGYNQSECIALGVQEVTGIPVDTVSVRRAKYNKSQTTFSHAERRHNVEDIFELIHPENLRNKHVLLIDDVITTGSTICSCASVIAQAENVKVSVLSVAFAGQTPIPDSDSELLFY